MDEIINRVANSSLLQLDLEDWYDNRAKEIFDIAPHLYNGLILRELDFRAAIKQHNWQNYENKHLGIVCSAEAIIPTWAFMLVANAASPFAASVHFGDKNRIDENLFHQWISRLDVGPYTDQKVIVKGCSKHPVPISAYVDIAARLTPVVQSLMFGEPCSNVPLYKRKNKPPVS